MAEKDIHSLVISFTKLFSGDDIKDDKQSKNVSSKLFEIVNQQRNFDSIRVELLTNGQDYFKFSGKIFGPVPRFDQIVSFKAFEENIQKSFQATKFNFHASVRLSISYSISEFQSFLDRAEDNDLENANLFDWIQYCTDDATEVLGAEIAESQDLRPRLSVIGI